MSGSQLNVLVVYFTRVALVVAVVAVAVVLLNKAGLAFPVKGVSMLPAIKSGDLAVTVPCKAEDVAPGSIVVYRDRGGKYIIHRVIARNDGVLTVKGDNNPWPDYQRVSDSNLVGCVVIVVRGMGLLVEPPANTILSIVLVLLFLANLALLIRGRAGFK